MEISTKRQEVQCRIRQAQSDLRRGVRSEKTRQLAALDPAAATPGEVDEILGYDATQNKCYGCKRDVDILVQVGEEPEYESRTAWLCKDCLTKALELITAEEGCP